MRTPDRKDRCVHCHALLTPSTTTKDHIFPSSWYPASTPQNLAKWTVPSCKACNERYSRIEEELLTRFTLCLDPKAEAAVGLYDRVKRSINLEDAPNQREAKIRKAKLRKLNLTYLTNEEIQRVPAANFLPGFGPFSNDISPDKLAVIIPFDFINSYIEKLCKGLAFKLEGIYLDLVNEQEILFLPRDVQMQPNDSLPQQLLQRHATTYSWGNAIIINRFVNPIEPALSVTYIELWQRWKFYAAVRKKRA